MLATLASRRFGTDRRAMSLRIALLPIAMLRAALLRAMPLWSVATTLLGSRCPGANRNGDVAILALTRKMCMPMIGMPMPAAPMMQSQPENRKTSVDREDHRLDGWMALNSVRMGLHAILRDKTKYPQFSYSTIRAEECSRLFWKSRRSLLQALGLRNGAFGYGFHRKNAGSKKKRRFYPLFFPSELRIPHLEFAQKTTSADTKESRSRGRFMRV